MSSPEEPIDPSAGLHPQEEWDALYASTPLWVPGRLDPCRHLIERFVKRGGGSCFEVGCFPGSYLAVFGELGYEVNGIDQTPRVEKDLPEWLRKRGARVGSIQRADFFALDASVQYDVVYSLGFVEHYEDWGSVIAKHASLVKPGGLLIITAPNLVGAFQHALHHWLDREALDRHNLKAMNPHGWADVVRPLGFDVLFSGFFGRFEYSVQPLQRPVAQRLALRVLKRAKLPLWLLLPPGRPAYAPHVGVVARKLAAA
jgi:2-polyprenyl-3-methyl-5-hydroxy-6-metoxy-1,4-benzoquinol methylase